MVILRKIYKNMEEGVPGKIHCSGKKLTKTRVVSEKWKMSVEVKTEYNEVRKTAFAS